MNFTSLQEHVKSLRELLLVEEIMPHLVREKVKTFMFSLTLLLFLSAVLVYLDPGFKASPYLNLVRGLFLVSFSITITVSLFEAYFYSLYFKNYLTPLGVSFIVLHIAYFTQEEDITYGFLASSYGHRIMMRLGLALPDIEAFLRERVRKVDSFNFRIENSSLIDLPAYAAAIFDNDTEFQEFLFKRSIDGDEIRNAAAWEENLIEERMNNERWWSRENLGRIPGIGKDWAFGQTNILSKYGRDITGKGKGMKISGMYENEVDKIEAVLSREREANVLLVGDDETAQMKIVESLGERIINGKVFPELEHKKVFILDTNLLIDSGKDKTHFETELSKLLNEAVYAENIILVLPRFGAFLASAKNIGSDVISILDSYLISSALQCIALSGVADFHLNIEPNAMLRQAFEVVNVMEKGEEGLIRYVEEEASALEAKNAVFFTYQAIEEIVHAAKRFYEGEERSDKTIDILLELIPYAKKKGISQIKKTDVLSLVESKTGIPTGEIKSDEKEKLLHLEDILHKRIVGQDDAVNAISDALRRTRSGIGNTSKPIGSFLFLGPTGVGKTETTKALKDAYFGTDASLLRLDMSEYTGEDALSKLIGSFGNTTPGILSTLVREHPYGVLLVDEFEKTTSEVKNLFLQIFDEGFFSDMRGTHVNLKNLIIIATSNAGSEMIFNLVKANENLVLKKKEIVNEIIAKGIFKPELLNRFDGIIVFHPLQDGHIRKVARLLLSSLQKRLSLKGIEMSVNDDLVDFLLSKGMDPEFGARPMNRAISEEIEAKVAEEIIKGTISSGSHISFKENSEGQLTVINAD